MASFSRIAWVASVVALGGCTALLGLDNEYRLGSTTTQGGGGDDAGNSGSTGGASATSSTGSVGGGNGGASSSGTGGSGVSSTSTSSASSTGSGVPCVSDGGPCDCDNDKALATSCATGTDCNDQNSLVYPGQKSFFKDKIAGSGSSYDYDCDGKEDYEVTVVINCVSLNCNTTTVGWKGTVPECGVAGEFGTCKLTGLTCVEYIQGTQAQRCH